MKASSSSFLILVAVITVSSCSEKAPVETVPPEVLDPDRKAQSTITDKTRTAIAKSTEAAKAADAYPSDIRPPQAEDLEHYIKDLGSAGSLIAIIETDRGEIRCELYEDKTPMTVANFVGLARGIKPFRGRTGEIENRPFYDGLTFHRTIPTFMIQGGDPEGTGSGGPGYRFANEIHPLARHDGPGTLAMANAGPGTNGSQFYITEAARDTLNDKYSVFGRCKNIGVVRDIARVETGDKNRPLSEVTMKRISIIRGDL